MEGFQSGVAQDSLLIPRQAVNLQTWSTQDTQSLILSAHGLSGTVTITCTVLAVTNGSLPKPPNPLCNLASLDGKSTLFGPKLDGFSYVSCIPPYPEPAWDGWGNCMNISFLDGTGNVKSHLYICSPSNKPYVVVRYGFGSNFDYSYNEANSNRSWYSNAKVIREYTTTNNPTAVPASFVASWTTIRGSKKWWAEIRPRHTRSETTGLDWYYPCTQLLLYYDYGDTNIEAPEFYPNVDVFPGEIIPYPIPGVKPDTKCSLVLNGQQPQLTFSPQWFGMENDAQRNQLELEREQLERNKRAALYWQQCAEELSLTDSVTAVAHDGEDTRKVRENLDLQPGDLFLDS